MAKIEYEVWGRPVGKSRPVYYLSFSRLRWQWAQKLAAFLENKGLLDVEIRTVKVKEKGKGRDSYED